MTPLLKDGAVTLSPEAELALLCRILAREGYCDNIAGHITYAQPDETFLINPFEFVWEEVCASDVMRIDAEGHRVGGKWSITPAIPLHVEAHKARPEMTVVVHNHPRWATLWAIAGRQPPIYEQTGAYIEAEIALFDEYHGGVTDVENARAAAKASGRAGCVLLRNHGVMVMGKSIRQAHLRAVALETRSRIAWHMEALPGGVEMDTTVASKINGPLDTPTVSRLRHLWDSAVRRELRADPDVLK